MCNFFFFKLIFIYPVLHFKSKINFLMQNILNDYVTSVRIYLYIYIYTDYKKDYIMLII